MQIFLDLTLELDSTTRRSLLWEILPLRGSRGRQGSPRTSSSMACHMNRPSYSTISVAIWSLYRVLSTGICVLRDSSPSSSRCLGQCHAPGTPFSPFRSPSFRGAMVRALDLSYDRGS